MPESHLKNVERMPKEVWTCRDWVSGEGTTATKQAHYAEICKGCPDISDCDGPVSYLLGECGQCGRETIVTCRACESD